jgi:hypothetical protein
MADTFLANIAAQLGYKGTSGHGNSLTDSFQLSYYKELLLGSGIDQSEAGYFYRDTLANGETHTFDLTNLERYDAFATSYFITFITIRALLIVSTSAGGGDGELVIGNNGANEWWAPFGAAGDTIDLPAGGVLLLSNAHCGWEVDNSNKILKVAASGGECAHDVIILGTTSIPAESCSSSA